MAIDPAFTSPINCKNILLDGMHCGGRRCIHEAHYDISICCIHCENQMICSDSCKSAMSDIDTGRKSILSLPLLEVSDERRQTNRPEEHTVIMVDIPPQVMDI